MIGPRRAVRGAGRRAARLTGGWSAKRGQNLVLSYHRIAPQPTPDRLNLVVDVDRFDRQIEALARRYRITTARACRQRGDGPCIAITFDDGYADNATVAAPLLRRHRVPATFFVTTDAFDDEREFWWDHLEHLLLEDGGSRSGVELPLDGQTVQLRFESPEARLASYRLVVRALRRRPPAVAAAVTDHLADVLGASLPTGCARHRRMTADMVAALAAEPLFEIGSHTCSHAPLSAVDRAEARRQLTASRRVLGSVIGQPPRLLAYPYGAPPSVGRRARRHARAAGYELAFVNTSGAADRSPRLAVHRMAVRDCEPEELLADIDRWLR